MVTLFVLFCVVMPIGITSLLRYATHIDKNITRLLLLLLPYTQHRFLLIINNSEMGNISQMTLKNKTKYWISVNKYLLVFHWIKNESFFRQRLMELLIFQIHFF